MSQPREDDDSVHTPTHSDGGSPILQNSDDARADESQSESHSATNSDQEEAAPASYHDVSLDIYLNHITMRTKALKFEANFSSTKPWVSSTISGNL